MVGVAPPFETLRVAIEGSGSVEGRIARVTLNRPERLNALSARLLAEVVDCCNWLQTRGDVRVVILDGAGSSFSAGFDLGDFTSSVSGGSSRDGADLGRRAAEALTNVPQITIAMIHGNCVGGGVVLTSACDLRFAASSARFSIPEVDLGIPLAWGGVPRLVREIGPARTKELVLLCRPFGSDEATRIGFLNGHVPDDALREHVDAVAGELAIKPLYALRTTKQQVNAVTEEIVGTGRSVGDADALVFALHDAESREARRAYIERLAARRGTRE